MIAHCMHGRKLRIEIQHHVYETEAPVETDELGGAAHQIIQIQQLGFCRLRHGKLGNLARNVHHPPRLREYHLCLLGI